MISQDTKDIQQQPQEQGTKFGELRSRYIKVLPHVRRALHGLQDPKERKIKRNAAFVAADSLMQDVAPIIEKSKIDQLTKLNTKEGFEEILTIEAEKAKLSGENLMVVFIDLNNFKSINDTLGHNFGNEVIAQMGGLIGNSIRPTDVAGRVEEEPQTNGHAGRFGGDEFMVLLKNTDEAGANSFFRRLAERFPSIAAYQTLILHGINVTMSAGATRVNLNNPLDSITNADREMYLAKAVSHKNSNTNQISIREQPMI